MFHDGLIHLAYVLAYVWCLLGVVWCSRLSCFALSGSCRGLTECHVAVLLWIMLWLWKYELRFVCAMFETATHSDSQYVTVAKSYLFNRMEGVRGECVSIQTMRYSLAHSACHFLWFLPNWLQILGFSLWASGLNRSLEEKTHLTCLGHISRLYRMPPILPSSDTRVFTDWSVRTQTGWFGWSYVAGMVGYDIVD